MSIANGPTVGGVAVTLFGANFAVAQSYVPDGSGRGFKLGLLKERTIFGLTDFVDGDFYRNINLASSDSPLPDSREFTYISDSSVVLTMPSGAGINNGIVWISTSQNSWHYSENVFSFDAPVVTQVTPSNGPPSGGITVTVSGFNFARAVRACDPVAIPKDTNCASAPAISIGSTKCVTTAWINRNELSAVSCVLANGTQARASVRVKSTTPDGKDGAEGVRLGGFNYDAPIVRGFAQTPGASVPASGSAALVLTVDNIGLSAPAPTKPFARLSSLPMYTQKELESQLLIAIDGQYCLTTAWLTASSARCVTIVEAPSSGGALIRNVSVSIGGNTGSAALDFSSSGVVCANACNQALNRGKCVANKCVCTPPFTGADCSLSYCSGVTETILTAATGTITDHTELTYFYIPWYLAGRNCAWLVKPSAGQLEISVSKFDLHPAHNVSIYAGTDSAGTLVATLGGSDTLWGSNVPGPLRIPGGVAFIQLNTGAGSLGNREYPQTGYTGFELTYISKDAGCPANCNSHVGQGECKNSKCECVDGWGGLACEVGYVALQDNFTDIEGVTQQLWLETKGAVFNIGCGEYTGTTGKSFHFRSRGSRYLVSPKIDFSAGGTISFYLRIGAGLRGACESATPTRPGVFNGPSDRSEVHLQWTTAKVINATSEWKTFETAIFRDSPYQTFRLVQVKVSDQARVKDVTLRWIQPKRAPDSPAFEDVWALDDITVLTPFVCPKSAGKICGGRGTCIATNQCKCQKNFFGDACSNACYVNYWHETECGCPAQSDVYAS